MKVALPNYSSCVLIGLFVLIMVLKVVQFVNHAPKHPSPAIGRRQLMKESVMDIGLAKYIVFNDALSELIQTQIARAQTRVSKENRVNKFAPAATRKPFSNGIVVDLPLSKVIIPDYNNTYKNATVVTEKPLPLCLQIPPGLGVEVPSQVPSKEKLSQIKPGGLYKNKECLPHQTLAVIIPYGGNETELVKFLEYMHPFLMKQQSDYQVFVVQATNLSAPINLGQLMNVGFLEAEKIGKWHCMIFHEPTLLPLDSRNLYRCGWYPRQLVMAVQTADNKTVQVLSGGAIAITPEEFIKTNGFSVVLRGKDIQNHDFLRRLQWANYTLETSSPAIAKYKGLLTQDKMKLTSNPPIFNLPENSLVHLIDGLTTLNYKLEDMEIKDLYTLMKISYNYKSNEYVDFYLNDV